MFIALFILTGCTAKYELTFDDGVFKEHIEIKEEINTYIINYAYSLNNSITENDINESLAIRPVVYLKSRMLLLSGNGTFDSPFVVK